MPHPYPPRSTRKTLLHSRRTSSSVHLHKTILFHNHCWFVRLGGRSRPCILRRRTHTSSYRRRHQHLSLDHNDTLQFASLSKQTKESLTQQYLWQISWESPYGPSFQCFNYERQRGPVGLQNSLYFCVFKCARTVRRLGQAHFAPRYAKPILRKKNPTVLQSIAEWSASRTRNPAVPGSSPALTTCWICSRVVLSSNPRPRL